LLALRESVAECFELFEREAEHVFEFGDASAGCIAFAAQFLCDVLQFPDNAPLPFNLVRVAVALVGP